MGYNRDEVFPLERLPQDHQERIAALVAQPKPPPRWLDFGLFQLPSRAWWEWHWQRGLDPNKRRPAIPKHVRAAVFERDGHRCAACGATEDLTLDHIKHYSRGGADVVGNLRTLCRRCNSSRQTKTDVEWLGADL